MTTAAPAIQDAVARVWGFSELRPMQSAAIAAGVAGRDCLTVLPTGGGKSLCYQVPPLVTGKATIVVSPLIALMRDQVRGLELNGYPAAAIHSGIDAEEARAILRRLVQGEINLVLAAPERVVTPGFKSFLASLADADRLGAIAVDEAHCISQWGHDFRPEYRRLAELREVAPRVPMQAFTATATPRVREDIVRQLNLGRVGCDDGKAEVLVGTFDRPNLTYRVRARRDAAEQTAEAVRTHQRAGDGGGTIVYCLSRKDTENLAEQLQKLRINAEAYHAGLNEKTRRDVEHRFSNETLDVVVATVAFGMGIDRSNVRLVVHATMPKSIEAYQQETGRAGRDGEPAECLLLYNPSDATRWERLIRMSNAEMGADAESTEAQLNLVREMRRLISAMGCRHRMLSEHFGQKYAPPEGLAHCNACDVCLGETEAEGDSKRIGQIILSAVARTNQRYGVAHIVDILRGADTERVRAARHDQLTVYALLKDHRKPALASFIDQLVAAEALERVIDGHFETLRFGPRGVAVMKGEETVPLARPVGTGSAKSERRRRDHTPDAAPLSFEEKQLFEKLRQVRMEIATERAVPPYVVFSDATLRELVRVRPESLDAMLEVKGIGRAKLEAFGETFLHALKD
ncbi:MAG: ATP-dependent DNA helicase [Phycisphaerales bacterium]|nr:ATP-dependent DNA helicase RecQ [Planctomycetota bacterium]MCH8509445.1 ATP-dependent DNA helicase [Phycisphaerales bacterium]